MRVGKGLAALIGLAIAAYNILPYGYAYTLPEIDSYLIVVHDPVPLEFIPEWLAIEVHNELSDLKYVSRFPELTPNASNLVSRVDCGSYAILAASKLYERGYDPYLAHMVDKNGEEHIVVIYHDGNGWGSIGGLAWDDKPPIYPSIEDLTSQISNNYTVDFIFKFSPEVYSGSSRIQLKLRK
jgi:hypothetical protein